jgi:uncharacterized membrane protein YdfJ with MMPL/SSD domain
MVALERALGADPGVAATFGPATAYEAELDVLLDPALGGWTEINRLAPRFDGPIDAGLDLVDLTPPAARVYAFCRPGPPDDRRRLAALIEIARADIAQLGGALHVAGPPLLNLALDDAGRAVERVALPVLAVVCAALLIGLTRSLRTSLAVLLPVALGVLAAEGLLTAIGQTTDIIVNIAKPLLFVLLLATALHIVVAWQDLRRDGLDRRLAPWAAARSKARACTLAIGTTALGFASLATSEMPSIRTFGLLSAAGLGLGLPLMLLVLPALLQFIGGAAPPRGGRWSGEAAAWCIARSLRHPRWMITAALFLTFAGLATVPLLPISTGGVHYFADDARIRQDYEAIAAAGLGLSTVELVLEAPVAGAFADAALLEAVDRFARAIEALPGARQAVGLPLFLREGNWRATGQDALPAGSALRDALGTDALGTTRSRPSPPPTAATCASRCSSTTSTPPRSPRCTPRSRPASPATSPPLPPLPHTRLP